MNAIGKAVLGFLGAQRGEERLVLYFVAYSFLLGLSASLLDISAYSLFLSSFGAEYLPWVYIGIGALLTFGTFAYGWLSERIRTERFLTVVILFNLASLLITWLGLNFTSSEYLKLLLPILQELVVFLDTMIFWEYSDRLFNIRQGKRLFGKIHSFHYLSVIIGGSGAALLAAPLGIENIMGMTVGTTAIILLLGLKIKKTWPDEFANPESVETVSDEIEAPEPTISDVVKNRLAILIFAMVIVGILEYYVLDNVFYTVAGARYPEDEEFATFYGTFSAISGLVCWIALGLFTGPVLSRFGLQVSLLIMPVALLLAVSATFLAGIMVVPPGFLFWMIIGTKMLDDVLTPAFNDSSVDVLYQVLPASIRSRARSVADGIAYPLSAAFAGALLLLLTGPLALDVQSLLLITVILVLACVFIAWFLPREYKNALTHALSSRNLGKLTDFLGESSSTEALQRGLKDPSASRALYCLEMLGETDEELFGLALVALIDHPDARVRREALKRMERLRERRDLSRVVANSLAQDPEMNVRGQALRTMAHLIEADKIDEVAVYLESEDDELRLGSMVGLIRSGGIAGILTAGNTLMENLHSKDPANRILAADVIGEVGIREFYQPLLTLLDDPLPEVRKAALRSAKALKSPKTVSAIIGCADEPHLRAEAISALISIGAPAVAQIDGKLKGGCETNLESRLVFALGRIPGPQSFECLAGYLSDDQRQLRRPVAAAILAHGDQLCPELLNKLREWIEAEAEKIARNLMVSQSLQQYPDSDLILRALHQDIDRRRETLFFFLALIYPSRVIMRTRSQLAQRSAEKRALAIEMLDNILTGRHKQVLLPLIETDDRAMQFSKMRSLFEMKPLSADQWLNDILVLDQWQESAWIRCTVLHVLGGRSQQDLSDLAGKLLNTGDRHVREMAEWAIGQLDKSASHAARHGLERVGEKMLTPVERVIFLKGVSIFSQLPDTDLLELSDRLREITRGPNAPIIVEGDLGTSMFVVVSGGVRVHSGDVTIVELGEGAVFGELAALDPEPRSASVTTNQETLLFTLDDDAMSDLMDEHPTVARGIIRVLCQRLRETTSKKR